MRDWIWEELGIDETEDVGAIKRAYSARLKTIDREWDLQSFQALRRAYDSALKSKQGTPQFESASGHSEPHESALGVPDAVAWSASECLDGCHVGVKLQADGIDHRYVVALSDRIGEIALGASPQVETLSGLLERTGELDSLQFSLAVSQELLGKLYGRLVKWPTLARLASRFHWTDTRTDTGSIAQRDVFDWIRRIQIHDWLRRDNGAPPARRADYELICTRLGGEADWKALSWIAILPFLRDRLLLAELRLREFLGAESIHLFSERQKQSLFLLAKRGFDSRIGWLAFLGRSFASFVVVLIASPLVSGAWIGFLSSAVIAIAVVFVLQGTARTFMAGPEGPHGADWAMLFGLFLVDRLMSAFLAS